MAKRRLLVIGWDGADWEVIEKMRKAGRMPCLSRLLEEGVWGNLASLRPCLTPMLWTSVATGMTADRHGILGFVEPGEGGFGMRVVGQGSRRVRAVWEMLGERGLRSVVLGWPVTGPAEETHGVMVSDRVLDTLRDRPEDIGDLADGVVTPAELRAEVSGLRQHPCDFSPWDLREMIPGIGGIDVAKDPRPAQLARALARGATVHNVATALVGRDDWDFFAVYYDMIDRVGHDFMAYRAPRMAGVSEEDFRRYGRVVDEVYAFHDAMLGRLLELAGPDVGVLLLSDHGFQTGSRRPRYRGPGGGGGIAEDGADWHRMHGVLLMHGPGIRSGERVFGATLLDMAPTLLAYFGLPAGKDMPGRVLSSALVDDGGGVPRVASWEEAGPRRGRDHGRVPRPLDEAAVRDLVAMGYLRAGVEEGAAAARRARREQDFNVATVYLSTARPAQAVSVFRRLVAEEPGEARYRLGEIEALAAEGRHREVLVAVAAFGAAGGENAFVEMAAAAAHFALGDAGMSGRCMERAQRLAGDHPDVLQMIGQMHLERGRYSLAQDIFAGVVAMDSGHFPAMTGWAEASLELRQYELALEKAVAGLRMAYWNPRCQLVLGRILLETGGYADAVRAFRLAIAQAPRWVSAHQWLAEALAKTGDPVGARRHREMAVECMEEGSKGGEPVGKAVAPVRPGGAEGAGDEILVVTGLPRSGTSLMMQMLAVGGYALQTDGVRAADAHNEAGYHEWEPVKQLFAQPERILEARGKAVKVVAALLPSLPEGCSYAVVCLRRDEEEVAASQRTMIGGAGGDSSVSRQLAQLEASLQWLRSVSGLRLLDISFRSMLERPADVAREVAAFARLPDDRVAAMAGVVRRELSRHSR